MSLGSWIISTHLRIFKRMMFLLHLPHFSSGNVSETASFIIAEGPESVRPNKEEIFVDAGELEEGCVVDSRMDGWLTIVFK